MINVTGSDSQCCKGELFFPGIRLTTPCPPLYGIDNAQDDATHQAAVSLSLPLRLPPSSSSSSSSPAALLPPPAARRAHRAHEPCWPPLSPPPSLAEPHPHDTVSSLTLANVRHCAPPLVPPSTRLTRDQCRQRVDGEERGMAVRHCARHGENLMGPTLATSSASPPGALAPSPFFRGTSPLVIVCCGNDGVRFKDAPRSNFDKVTPPARGRCRYHVWLWS